MAKGDLSIELDEKQYQELMGALGGLEKVDQNKVVKESLDKGMQIIVDAGKANLAQRNNVVTGNLKKSLAKKVLRSKGVANAGFKRSTKGSKISGGNHAHLVDRGTKQRWTKKTHAYRGSVSKSQPNKGSMFWTDAVTQNGEKAVNKIMDAVYDSISKIMTNK